MRSRRVTSIAVVSAVAVVASCGAEEAADPTNSVGTTTAVTPVAATSTPANLDLADVEIDPDDVANLTESDIEPLSIRDETASEAPVDLGAVNARSGRLVDRFGADGAFDALLYAVGRGYSIEEIEAGVDDEALQPDGIIVDVVPTAPASGLLILPQVASGFALRPTTADEAPLPVEELRQTAAGFRRVFEQQLQAWEAPEIATAEGVVMLNAVQALAHAGLSGDQIINALVLGYGGITRRVAQIGMGPAASCRMVIIGGRAEPIANESGCNRYAEVDTRLRSVYAEYGVDYPPCTETSIEGIYDACAAATPAATTPITDTTTTTASDIDLPTTWEGPMTFDPVAGDLVDSFVAIDRDGSIFTLNAFIEFTRASGDCSWVEEQVAEGVGELTPDGSNIVFDGTFTSDIAATGSDCAGGSESVETTYQVGINGDVLSGSIFAYTEFELSPSVP